MVRLTICNDEGLTHSFVYDKEGQDKDSGQWDFRSLTWRAPQHLPTSEHPEAAGTARDQGRHGLLPGVAHDPAQREHDAHLGSLLTHRGPQQFLHAKKRSV